jgi:hypothetical protein
LNFGLGEKIEATLMENLEKNTRYFFGISISRLDYVLLAGVPVFGMLYNSTRSRFRKQELIMDLLTLFFSMLIFFGIGIFFLIFVGGQENPLIPNHLLTEPFDIYLTLFIGYGILIPFILIKLMRKKTE